MIQFIRHYLEWKKLRNSCLAEWNEKYSRTSILLEIEILQKELFLVDAEIMAKTHASRLLKDSLDNAKTRLKAIEEYV